MKEDLTIKIPLSQSILDAIAHRYGQKTATQRDYRAWAEGAIEATLMDLIQEKDEAKDKARAVIAKATE